MWEAVEDRYRMTEANVSYVDADKLAEGMGRILEVIPPIIALEYIVRSCTELRKKVLFKLGDAMTKIPKTKPTSLHVVVVIY